MYRLGYTPDKPIEDTQQSLHVNSYKSYSTVYSALLPWLRKSCFKLRCCMVEVPARSSQSRIVMTTPMPNFWNCLTNS
jgi:hypothetical protein